MSFRINMGLTLISAFVFGIATTPKAFAQAKSKPETIERLFQDAADTPFPTEKPAPSESTGTQSTVGSYTKEDKAAMDALFATEFVAEQVKNTGVGVPIPKCKPPAPPARAVAQSSSDIEFKSIEEIGAYINCYMDENDLPDRTPAQRREREKLRQAKAAYFKTYKGYIDTAAAEFDIPAGFLTCLLMRESQFDKNDRSPVGALGMAQFMPDTMKYISAILTKMDDSPEKIASLTALATNEDGKTPARDQEYAKTYLFTYKLSQRWKSYFERLKAEGKFKGKVPTKYGPQGAKTPEIAIAASAFYLRYMINLFEDELNQHGRINTGGDGTAPDFDFLITIGGAYNLGHGSAVRVLSKVRPPSASKWRDRLSKLNAETRLHMLSIANCLEKGNMKPPGTDRQKECPQ